MANILVLTATGTIMELIQPVHLIPTAGRAQSAMRTDVFGTPIVINVMVTGSAVYCRQIRIKNTSVLIVPVSILPLVTAAQPEHVSCGMPVIQDSK